MSFNPASVAEQFSSRLSFTISQVAPGALLEFDPPLHTKELAEAIHNYIPGPFTLQEKQRQISSDFCFWRSQACPEGPASYLYDASPAFEFSSFSGAGSYFDESLSNLSKETSKSTKPARRSRASKVVKKTPVKAASTTPRLPGFSIMTKDGVDVTDAAPRGPKTKEQREHAALIRKLQACPTCKKRKQRCNPSHHTRNNTSSSSPSTKTSSPSSSADESKASTPASSGNSPVQRYSQAMQISQTGQNFNGSIPTPKTALTPSDFSFDFASFDAVPGQPSGAVGLDMSMDTIEPNFFDGSLDFFDWDNYQDSSHSGFAFSNTPVTNQSYSQDSLAFAESSQSLTQSLTNTSATSNSSAAQQFFDFVPAWDSGSTPYVPMNGSRLQSPEEFGMQADFSRVISPNNQTQDHVHPASSSSQQPQQLDTQMYSLFGEYPPTSVSSPAALTPSSMATSSSSQGQFSSTYGSPFASTDSPRSSALAHISTIPSHGQTFRAGDLSQSQSFDNGHTHLQLTFDYGSPDSQGGLDGGVYHNSARRQAPGLVHASPQMTHSLDATQSAVSSLPMRSFGQVDPQGRPTGEKLHTRATRSTASDIEFTNSMNWLESTSLVHREVHREASSDNPGRMAPAIQSSWGGNSQPGPNSQDIPEHVNASVGSSVHTAPVNDALRAYQVQLMHLEKYGKKVCGNRHPELRVADSQSSCLDVIPRGHQDSDPDVIPRRQRDRNTDDADVISQSSSRPFRAGQVEDMFQTTPGRSFTHPPPGGMSTSDVSPEAMQARIQTARREAQPFRAGQVEDSYSVDSRELETSSHDAYTVSREEQIRSGDRRSIIAGNSIDIPRHEFLHQQGRSIVLESQNTAPLRSGVANIISDGIQDRQDMRTEAHRHAAVRSPLKSRSFKEDSHEVVGLSRACDFKEDSFKLAKRERSLPHDISLDTQLQGSPGLEALMLLGGYILVTSLIGLNPINALISAIISIYKLSTITRPAPNVDGTAKKNSFGKKSSWGKYFQTLGSLLCPQQDRSTRSSIASGASPEATYYWLKTTSSITVLV